MDRTIIQFWRSYRHRLEPSLCCPSPMSHIMTVCLGTLLAPRKCNARLHPPSSTTTSYHLATFFHQATSSECRVSSVSTCTLRGHSGSRVAPTDAQSPFCQLFTTHLRTSKELHALRATAFNNFPSLQKPVPPQAGTSTCLRPPTPQHTSKATNDHPRSPAEAGSVTMNAGVQAMRAPSAGLSAGVLFRDLPCTRLRFDMLSENS